MLITPLSQNLSPKTSRTIPYQDRVNINSSVTWLSTGTVEFGTGTGTARNRYGSETCSGKEL